LSQCFLDRHDELSNGRKIGRRLAAFDAIERLDPDARTAGQFGLAQLRVLAAGDEMPGKLFPIELADIRPFINRAGRLAALF